LKHVTLGFACKRRVAPRAGAWIETNDELLEKTKKEHVAPRAGAWIETIWVVRAIKQPPGRPPRGGVD